MKAAILALASAALGLAAGYLLRATGPPQCGCTVRIEMPGVDDLDVQPKVTKGRGP